MNGLIENSTTFGIVISIIGYEIGLLLRKRFNFAIINPLLISIVFVIAAILVFHIDYADYNKSAQYLSYLLTPATVSLAVPLYKNLVTLRKNAIAIITGIISGILANMVCIFLLALLFNLSHKEYITLLPKSITTVIGMGVSEEFGGIVAITVAVIIITGILGNIIAITVFKLFKIYEPIARGIALGSASHAIGTAKAMEMGEVEGSVSSLAMIVCGILTLVGVSVFANLI